MAASLPLLILLLLLALANNSAAEAVNQDGVHLLDAKRALTVPSGALADWDPRDATPCNWTGVSCDDGAVTGISLPDANLAGPFPGAALCRLPRLRSIDLNTNYIGGQGLPGLSGCKALQHLDLSMNELVGPLPAEDLPEQLVYLDLSSNNFSGPIPPSFGRLTKLQSLSLVYNLLGGVIPPLLGSVSTLRELNLSYNPFAPGPVPAELGDLSALRVLWLAGCNLVGSIPPSLGRLANLTHLDLSTNSLTGRIPPEVATGLASATQILLYNNSLSGPIPPRGFAGLRALRSVDLSMNRLDGAIPEDLFRAPKLDTVHLYANQLTGPLPASLSEATSLVELRLFANRLNGTLPADFGKDAPLVCVDLSDNAISGEIPPGICHRGELEELLMLDNLLSGSIPTSLGRCRSLRRVRLSNNRLTGQVPAALWGLPHVSLLELNDNRLTGGISPAVAGAANLSKLLLSNNRLTGSIPSEIGSASKLYELSADGNMLSGPLPASLAGLTELGRLVLRNNSLSGHLLRGVGSSSSWKKLSELNLAHNGFTGPIPPELGDLPVLNYLDLSGNRLAGEVPVQLENLKLNQFNVSDNQLSGPLPPQFAATYRNSFLGNPELCREHPALLCGGSAQQQHKRKQEQLVWMMRSIFIFAGVVLVAGVAWFYWRYRAFSSSSKKKMRKRMMDVEDRSKWTLTSFHKLSFSEYEILECLDEDNVIGSGASGKVYKAVLSNGEVVAVKKLFATAAADEAMNLFEAEVGTLGKIRHKNIVKLWCCCAHKECKLLVYEYMPNGSLGDVLHLGGGGKGLQLDWPTRYRIALDAAEGLSYLHHDCAPAIVHRDVKSNNILLDAHMGARVADFGVAKVVEASSPNKSMSVIAGSCGYIAPEYAYTLRVNEKSDTYSFGVVLLELVTGKPPVGHPDFGHTKDLVKWVCSTMEQTGGDGLERVLDARLLLLHTDDTAMAMMMMFKEEMCRVLHIGLLCASSLPINRPPMRRVVKMLREVRLLAADNNSSRSPPCYYHYYDDTTSTDQGSSV
jgi:kinase